MARTRTPRAPLVVPRREAPEAGTPPRLTPYRRGEPQERTGGIPGVADDASTTAALPRTGAPDPERSEDRTGSPGGAASPAATGTADAEPARPGAPERPRSRRRGLLPPPGAVTPAASGAPGPARAADGAEPPTGTESTGTESTGTESTGTESTGTESTGTESTGTDTRGGTEPRAGAHRTVTPTWLPPRVDGAGAVPAPAAAGTASPTTAVGPVVPSPLPSTTGPAPTAPAGVRAAAPAAPARAPLWPPAAAPAPAPRSVLPGVDRNGPLREIGASLRRRRAPVAGVVLLAAAGAAGLAVLFPPPTIATTSVQVGSVGTADPGPATGRALAAAGSAAFADRVAELTGGTVADVAGRLVLTAPGPGVVAVRATGTDEATATALAADAVTALRERLGALDAAVTSGGTQPLRAEIDRRAAEAQAGGTGGTDPVAEQLGRTLADRTGQVTVVVDGPDPVAAPEFPTARWAGGAAGIAAGAALLLAGLGVPAVRRGRGLLPEAHPEDRLRARLDVPVFAPGTAPDAVPRLAGAYRDLLRGTGCLTVVQLTPEPACDVASELVKAAALVGDRREYRDLTPGARATTAAAGTPVVRALRVPRLAHEDLGTVRDGGPTVLAVETAATTVEDVVTAVAALRAVGAPPLLCLVWSGRLPHDLARVPLPADARIRSQQHP
ncbi:hypothetical protein [Pseudonocardia sp. HH130629-09]|uniref:hypothetical protein n=1 Tax=Pseudonocardia sp. HH130629-09 TaxID=1641402 RepID=UPI0006CB6739|nr:hypothetical protein [Pseudonocardia sp. HH130629-09]ALE83831.1 hypothetical protein XF36_12290 [Pseudonocardia sp. HH130629-09]